MNNGGEERLKHSRNKVRSLHRMELEEDGPLVMEGAQGGRKQKKSGQTQMQRHCMLMQSRHGAWNFARAEREPKIK